MHKHLADSFYVDYFGCEKRKLDAQLIINYFIVNKLKRIDNVAEADIIVFITCAFCREYEDRVIKKITQFYQQKKRGAKIIIGGCLTSINPSLLRQFDDIFLLETRNLEKLDLIIDHVISIKELPDPNTTIFDSTLHEDQIFPSFRTPAHLEYEDAKKGFKIRTSYGCLGNCSYCVTKYATKKLRSKSEEVIVHEFKTGLRKGHKTFFFTGGDTGSYGIDQNATIVSLLRKILSFDGDYKIYLHDFGVNWLSQYFKDLLPLFQLQKNKLGCFNFPIQSGSNRILKLMRRPYKIERVKSLLLELKSKLRNLKIGTHIIVGFPGETENDFNKSIQLIEDVNFDFLMVFPYSDNPLAESYSFPDKLSLDTVNNRFLRIGEIFQESYKRNLNRS